MLVLLKLASARSAAAERRSRSGGNVRLQHVNGKRMTLV